MRKEKVAGDKKTAQKDKNGKGGNGPVDEVCFHGVLRIVYLVLSKKGKWRRQGGVSGAKRLMVYNATFIIITYQ